MLELNGIEYDDEDPVNDPDDAAPADRQQEIDDAHVDDGLALRVGDAFDRLRKRAASPKREGRGMLVCGPSGTGKSHALKRLALCGEFAKRETPNGIVRPVLEVSAPAPCTLKTLGREIYLRLTGVEMRSRVEEHEIWSRVRAHLAAQKVKYLFIDEMHHVLIGRNREEHRKVAETFKTTMQMPEWPVYLVLAGMPESLPFVRQHAQLMRRVRKIEIVPVPQGAPGIEAVRRHVEILIDKLGIVTDFDLTAMAPRLHIASSGYLGLCAQLIKDATELALDEKEATIRAEDLAEAYADLHAANGREIDAERNPFLCSDLSLATRTDHADAGRQTSLIGKGRNRGQSRSTD